MPSYKASPGWHFQSGLVALVEGKEGFSLLISFANKEEIFDTSS